METRQQAADACMVDLRLSGDGIGDGQFAVGDAEGGEVDSQLKADMNEFIVHIRSVLRLLCPDGNMDKGQKTKD